MKIIAAVRTLNEERNIERFCRSYTWADKVIVADGGSTDKTVDLAKKFGNVEVRTYPVYVDMNNGMRRNPHGSHVNYLIDWAFLQEKADWIIFDDCDCFPNTHVKAEMRKHMEDTPQRYVYVTRLYAYMDKGHFPKLAKPNGDWTPSLYAWHKDTRLRLRDDLVGKAMSKQELIFKPDEREILKLMPPYALIHQAWQDKPMVDRKIDFYRRSGQIEDMEYPIDFGGNLEPLPEWAILEER